MCNPHPVNAGILLDSLILISILNYYLGWCFISNYEVIVCRNAADSLTMVIFLSQLKLYAITFVAAFSTFEIMN